MNVPLLLFLGTALLAGAPGPPPPPCDLAVEAAVRRAVDGDLEGAAAILEAARVQCPEHVGVVRELAAVRFREGRYPEAEALARRLVELDPGAVFGWDLLGTLRYLDDDPGGALRAWNRIGRPRVEASSADELDPGSLLTPASLVQARRRIEALPVVARARVDWRPVSEGGARVDRAVVLHPPHSLTRGAIPGHLARAVGGMLEVGATDRVGKGERLVVLGSLDRDVRSASLALDHPVPGAGGAALRWGVHHRVTGEGDAWIQRSGARLGIVPWPGARVRSEGWIGVDRWPDPGGPGTHGAAGGRLKLDLVPGAELELDGSWWSGGFGRADVTLELSLPAPEQDARRLLPGGAAFVRGGIISTMGRPPADVSPRFGARRSSSHLMRATGWVRPPGDGWLHGSMETTWAQVTSSGLVLGGALFVDGVHGLGPAPPADVAPAPPAPRSALHPGIGLRLGLPGVDGWMRVDWAVNVADGVQRLSVGWMRPGG
jgi:hypothetical protein